MTDEATREGADIDQRIEGLFAEPEEEQPEQEAPEGEQQGEPEHENPDDGVSEDEGPQVELATIAAALGYDETDLEVGEDGAVMVRVKVDGEEKLVKPADLRKSYQLEGHLNKNNMEVQAERKALQEQRQKLEAEQTQKLTEAGQYLNIAWQQLTHDYQNIKWDELDDLEQIKLKNQIGERQHAIQNAYAQLQQQQSKLIEQKKAEEVGKLYEAFPEWRDDAARNAAVGKIEGAVKKYGFTKADLHTVMDHRLFKLLNDFAKYAEIEAQRPETTKRVRVAPKVAKAGQPVASGTGYDQALAKFKKSGGADGLDELLEKRGLLG